MAISTIACSNCGGQVTYDIDKQGFRCGQCDSRFTLEEIEDKTPDEKKADVWAYVQQELEEKSADNIRYERGAAFGAEIKGYACPNCGARVIVDEADTSAAAFCAFCQTHITVTDRLMSEEHAPLRIIPFQITREQAESIFAKACKGKPLLSKQFTSKGHIEEFRSVYVPFWLYDGSCNGSLRAKCTQVTSWSDSDYDYTKTDTYAVFRSGSAAFEKVPIDGSERMADDQMRAIEPFRTDALTAFSPKYIAGHDAECPDTKQESMTERFKNRAGDMAKTLFLSTIGGYSSVRVEGWTCGLANVRSEYVMFPVWMLVTNYNGKRYVFAINGQTGQLSGDLPVSGSRLAAWFAGLAVGATVLVTLAQEVYVWLS